MYEIWKGILISVGVGVLAALVAAYLIYLLVV